LEVKVHWNIAEAKQKLSDVVRRAASEPQPIFSREREVAVLVDADTFRAFQAWREREARRSFAGAFAELRQICADENYELTAPIRLDRTNPFADAPHVAD
jgi:prevent-host-death family protein